MKIKQALTETEKKTVYRIFEKRYGFAVANVFSGTFLNTEMDETFFDMKRLFDNQKIGHPELGNLYPQYVTTLGINEEVYSIVCTYLITLVGVHTAIKLLTDFFKEEKCNGKNKRRFK